MSIYEQLSGIDGMGIGPSESQTGIVLAEVTNISDPETMGRVKCRPLSVSQDVKETDWCFVMTPFGGKGYGLFLHPNVGDIVVLAYQNGEIHRPIVIGSIWNNESTAPYTIKDENNDIHALKTPKNNELVLDDTKDKENITIKTPSGAIVTINDEKKSIEISDGKAKNCVSLNWEKGTIELKAEKNLKLAVGNNEINMTSSGEITLKSSKKIGLDTVELASKTSAKTQIESSGQVMLKSSGTLNVEASGVTVIKGGLVKIN